MRKSVLFLIAVGLVLVSCKTIKPNDDNFAWKSFDNSEKDQSVDFSIYESPNNRLGQNEKKIVIVSSSGGGSRAAAFTTGILLELEKIILPNDSTLSSNVLHEVDYFSTTSGGGWGASSYIAYLYQKQKYSQPDYKKAISDFNKSLSEEKYEKESIEPFPTFNSYEKYLANRSDYRYFKYQIPLIFTFRFGAAKSDMIMTNRLNAGYLGWSYRDYIESKTWGILNPGVKYLKNSADEITLGDVFKSKGEKSYLPMLIANTTNIDNFKLIPFTPDRLNYWGVTEYRHYLNGFEKISTTEDLNNIPLASATKASSGIPFAMSSSTFPALKKDIYSNRNINYYLHLQDGGFVDRQGLHSTKAILLDSSNSTLKKENRIVIIIDSSSSGVVNNKKFKKKNAGRFYNLKRVASPFSIPDAQYTLTRENVKLFEDEYNCTVVYLGMEVLLDKSIKSISDSRADMPTNKKKVEEYFYTRYPRVQKTTDEFLNFNLNERKMLFSYVSQYVPTWFTSKGSKFKGRVLTDDNSSAKILFLAGRGVVQLKRATIESIFKQ